MDFLENSLFTTESIKIAPSDKPFWYTSGTIGPYFINTHFLYGSQKDAKALLTFINDNKDNYKNFIPELTERVISFYNSNELFKKVIDLFYSKLSQFKQFDECKYISGGERRDWFFSPIISHLSGKPHLFIYKNLNVYLGTKQILELNNANVCHICDLVTEASSHKRAWIPAIKNISGKIIFNAAIVDRDQGGKEYLEQEGITNYAAVIIQNDFLNKIKDNRLINSEQLTLIKDFKNNPADFGKNFLLKNPDFLKLSLENNETKSKAQICLRDNPYNIDFSQNA